MIDWPALANDLTDAFIQYQYRRDTSMFTPSDTLDMLNGRRKYLIDNMFRLKVDSLVTGVLQIISKHIKE